MGKLLIQVGDIKDYLAGNDAIVVPTNRFMSPGNNLTSTLYRLAGWASLTEYCRENFENYMQAGEIRRTPGFALNNDLLHLCLPEGSLEELTKAYIVLYDLILEGKYKKVLIPSFGGFNGYKDEDIYQMVIKLATKFCQCYDVQITLLFASSQQAKQYMDFYKILKW